MSSSSTNKLSHLKDQLLSIDFFSMRPSDRITFENHPNFSTLIGKFASWMLIAISVLTFVNFGSDMFYHKNPRSMLSQIVTPDPAYVEISENGYFMTFGLQDLRNKSIHYVDESIYTVQMLQRTKVGTNITLVPIPVGRCSIDQVPDRDDLKGYYARNQINNQYCVKNESQAETALQSTWDGPFYKNILLNIYPCKNSSIPGSIVCKPTEIIQAYLNSANYAMYFTNLAIDPGNFEKPITSFGKQLYTPISYTTLTYIEMLFGHFEFSSDEGFLIEDLNTTKSVQYLANRQILSFSSNMVVQIDMKLDKVKNIYTRKYSKLQEVLANMGGIIKALTLLGQFFFLPFIKLRFRLNLANSMFNFKSTKRVKEIKKKFSQKSNRSKNYISPMSVSTAGKLKRPKTNESSRGVADYFQQNSEKIQITYLQYYFTCFRDEISNIYKKLLGKGIYQIDRMLDLSYIMKKLTEIDMLKAILLDETQTHLFEYIPKPEISLELKDVKNDHNLHHQISKAYGRTELEKGKLAFEAYNVISKKIEKTNIDEKLLGMVKKMKKHNTTIVQSKEVKEDSPKVSSDKKVFHLKKDGFFEFGTQKSIPHELKSSMKLEEMN